MKEEEAQDQGMVVKKKNKKKVNKSALLDIVDYLAF